MEADGGIHPPPSSSSPSSSPSPGPTHANNRNQSVSERRVATAQWPLSVSASGIGPVYFVCLHLFVSLFVCCHVLRLVLVPPFDCLGLRSFSQFSCAGSGGLGSVGTWMKTQAKTKDKIHREPLESASTSLSRRF